MQTNKIKQASKKKKTQQHMFNGHMFIRLKGTDNFNRLETR